MRVSWRYSAAGAEQTAEVSIALRLPSAGDPAPHGVLLLGDDASFAEQGAVATYDQSLLDALSTALTAAGFTVLSCSGGSGDLDRGLLYDASRAPAALLAAARAGEVPGLPRRRAPLPWIALGVGSGARVACALARDSEVCAVVAVSFPLNAPPGGDAASRDRRRELEHVYAPLLIVSGAEDVGFPATEVAATLFNGGSCLKKRYDVAGAGRELNVAGAARAQLLDAVVTFAQQQAILDAEDVLRDWLLSAALYDDEKAMRFVLGGECVIIPEDPDYDVDYLAGKALAYACRYGSMNAVQLLIREFDAEPDFDALTEAISNGHLRAAEYLIEHGADPHQCDVFGIFDVGCTRLLLDHGVKIDPQNLVEAVRYGWFELLCFLLDSGITECRNEALALATARNKPRFIERLNRNTG